MTLSEAGVWSKYRAKRGSLNQGLRLEEGFAYVRAAIHNIMSKEAVDAAVFMPHVRPPSLEKEKAADISDVFGVLRAVAKSNNAAKRRREQP